MFSQKEGVFIIIQLQRSFHHPACSFPCNQAVERPICSLSWTDLVILTRPDGQIFGNCFASSYQAVGRYCIVRVLTLYSASGEGFQNKLTVLGEGAIRIFIERALQ